MSIEDRLRYSTENCSIARTLGVVGEKWTLLVLREAFYGIRRFDEIARILGCGRAVLTARLRTLVDEGVLERVPYRPPGERSRFEYRLTQKGSELFPVLMALLQWGDRWAVDAAGPAVELTHRGCSEHVSLTIRCDVHRGELAAADVAARPGPGARPMR
jgi:DNA-binding HxlR family transcriptional regulator